MHSFQAQKIEKVCSSKHCYLPVSLQSVKTLNIIYSKLFNVQVNFILIYQNKLTFTGLESIFCIDGLQ